MKKHLSKISNFLILGLTLVLMQGCADNEQINVNRVLEQTKNAQKIADINYKKLEQHVSDKNSRGKYELILAVALSTVSNEFKDNEAIDEMVKQFSLDTTKNGSIWKQVNDDYIAVSKNKNVDLLNSYTVDAPKNQLGTLTNLLNSYTAFSSSHNVTRFDERFIDYINTLASISKNVSPVIVDKIDSTAPVGSAFVGNPQYGQWIKDEKGNDTWSFLETYMYLSFLDNMLFDRNYGHNYRDYRSGYRSNPYNYSSSRGSSYRYDNWSNKRNYSYYNDTYVNKYAKSSEKKKYSAAQSNLTKKYTSTLKKDNNVSKQVKTINTKNSAFQSNLTKPRSASGDKGSNSSSKASDSNKRSAPQSNLTKRSQTSSVRNTSRSVSKKSGK